MDRNSFSYRDFTWCGQSLARIPKEERGAVWEYLTQTYENEIRSLAPQLAEKETPPCDRYVLLLNHIARESINNADYIKTHQAALIHVLPALFSNKSLVKAKAPNDFHGWITYAFDEKWVKKDEKKIIRRLTEQAGLFVSLTFYVGKMKRSMQDIPEKNDVYRGLEKNAFSVKLKKTYRSIVGFAIRPLTYYPRLADKVEKALNKFGAKPEYSPEEKIIYERFRYHEIALPFYPSFFATSAARILEEGKLPNVENIVQMSAITCGDYSVAEYDALYKHLLYFQDRISEWIRGQISGYLSEYITQIEKAHSGQQKPNKLRKYYLIAQVPSYYHDYGGKKPRAEEDHLCFPFALCKIHVVAESIASVANLNERQQQKLIKELPLLLYNNNHEKKLISAKTLECCSCDSTNPEDAKQQAKIVEDCINSFYILTSQKEFAEKLAEYNDLSTAKAWNKVLRPVMHKLEKLGFTEWGDNIYGKKEIDEYQRYIDFWDHYFYRGDIGKLLFDYSVQIPLFGEEYTDSDDDDDKKKGIEEFFDSQYYKLNKRIEKCLNTINKSQQRDTDDQAFGDDDYCDEDLLLRSIIRQEINADISNRIIEAFLKDLSGTENRRDLLTKALPEDSVVKKMLSSSSILDDDAGNLSIMVYEEALACMGRICTATLFQAMLLFYDADKF